MVYFHLLPLHPKSFPPPYTPNIMFFLFLCPKIKAKKNQSKKKKNKNKSVRQKLTYQSQIKSELKTSVLWFSKLLLIILFFPSTCM